MPEFQVRLGLGMPSELSKAVIAYQRANLGLTGVEYAQALDRHPSTITQWESGEKTPDFSATVALIGAEFFRLAHSEPFKTKDYDPKQGLIGRVLLSGLLTRAEIANALERLAEVMLTPVELRQFLPQEATSAA